MLVLTRRDEEGISLDLPDGRRVRLFVEIVGGGKAKLCIDAPNDVRVGRLKATRPPRKPSAKGSFRRSREMNYGK